MFIPTLIIQLLNVFIWNTEIGTNAVSISFIACILAHQIFESLYELHILLVGSGKRLN